MKFLFRALLFTSVSCNLLATQPHQAYIDLSHSEIDERNTEGETFRLHLPFKQGLFITGSKTSFDGDVIENDLEVKEIGAGFFWPTSPDSIMYLGYSKIDFKVADLETEDLTRYAIGWRGRLVPWFELNVEYNQTDFANPEVDEGGYLVGAHFYLTDTFAFTAETRRWYDEDILTIGIRFTSGR